MYKRLIGLGAALLVGAFLVARSTAADAPAISVGGPAPLFDLQDQNGVSVKLADYTGKIVVLEWFNEECPIVQRHYKDGAMNKLADKYTEKGVVWLAINSTSGKTNDNNKKAIDTFKMGKRLVLNDASGKIGHAYHSTNTPGMYIVDQKGNLAYWGGIDDNPQGTKTSGIKNYVAQALDEMLAGKPVSESKTQPYGCTVKYAD